MMKSAPLPLDCLDIHEIAWANQLDAFLLLTGEQLYRVTVDSLQPTPIHQIQVSVDEDERRTRRRPAMFSSFSKVLENLTWLWMAMIC